MTAGRSDLIDVACDLVYETDGAYLVRDGDRKVWIPKACSEWAAERGRFGTLTLPEGVAVDKELI